MSKNSLLKLTEPLLSEAKIDREIEILIETGEEKITSLLNINSNKAGEISQEIIVILLHYLKWSNFKSLLLVNKSYFAACVYFLSTAQAKIHFSQTRKIIFDLACAQLETVARKYSFLLNLNTQDYHQILNKIVDHSIQSDHKSIAPFLVSNTSNSFLDKWNDKACTCCLFSTIIFLITCLSAINGITPGVLIALITSGTLTCVGLAGVSIPALLNKYNSNNFFNKFTQKRSFDEETYLIAEGIKNQQEADPSLKSFKSLINDLIKLTCIQDGKVPSRWKSLASQLPQPYPIFSTGFMIE